MRPIQRIEVAAPQSELPSRVETKVETRPKAHRVASGATTCVVEAVARHLHIEPSVILGRDRHKTAALGRQIVMFVLREHQHPQPSFPEIANELGRSDHTTVMSAVKAARRKAVIDEHIRDAIEVGRIALQSLDMSREIRRLSLLAERDRLVRKASELNEELARMRLDEPIDESSRLSVALGERVQAAE